MVKSKKTLRQKVSTTPLKKIVKFYENDKIPVDATFLYKKDEFVRMYGWAHNPQPYFRTALYYEIKD